jgi:hypothetical protein
MNCLSAQKSSLPRQKNFPAPTLVEIRKLRIPQRDCSINRPSHCRVDRKFRKIRCQIPSTREFGIKPDPACVVGEI